MAAFWIEVGGKTIACEFDTLEQAQRHALAAADGADAKVTVMVGSAVPLVETYWDAELREWVTAD